MHGSEDWACVICRFMADMVIGYLMDQAATAAWMHHATHMKALPAPIKLEYPDMEHSELPASLFKNNGGNFTTECILDNRIQGHVIHNVVRPHFPPSYKENVIPQDIHQASGGLVLQTDLQLLHVRMAGVHAGLQLGQRRLAGRPQVGFCVGESWISTGTQGTQQPTSLCHLETPERAFHATD